MLVTTILLQIARQYIVKIERCRNTNVLVESCNL
jgi:hypothetical protein